MKLFKKMFQGAVLAAAILMVGSTASAAPYSNVNKLPAMTTDPNVVITFDYLGSSVNGSEVDYIDLYMRKDDGPFVKQKRTYNLNAELTIDLEPFGDGRYSFYAVATTRDGQVEPSTNITEAAVEYDGNAPAAPKTDKIYVNEAQTPDFDEVQGLIDSVEAYARVEVFSDAALKTLVASTNATDTGEWGPIQVGDNENAAIWVVAIDAHGNRSIAARVENSIDLANAVTAFHATAYASDRISLDYAGPASARWYRVEYKHANGSIWSAKIVTSSTTPELFNLEAGRAYDIRVAPVDEYGNVGVWVGTTIRTLGTKVGPGPETKVAVPIPANVGGDVINPVTGKVDGETAVAGETVTNGEAVVNGETTESVDAEAGTTDNAIVDTPSSSTVIGDEDTTAEVVVDEADQAATEEEASATPWVILAILIILAGIATGGYFYWFSGPEEVTTTVKSDKDDDKDKRW